MLETVTRIRRIVLCCGYVDLRKGIEGLSLIVGSRFSLNPYEKVWTGLGFLQLYLRFEKGRLSWPRTPEQAADLSEDQFLFLMQGYNPLETRVREVEPQKIN